MKKNLEKIPRLKIGLLKEKKTKLSTRINNP